MNPTVKVLLPILAFSLCLPNAFAGGEPRILEIELNDRSVYTVPVSASRVTTISFPGAISAIDAALVSTDAKTNGLFQLAHKPGAVFFSVRTLVQGSKTNVNVRSNGKTYILELQDSSEPVLALNFRMPPDDLRRIPVRTGVTPNTLVGLLDKAKAYPLLKTHHPESLEKVDSVAYGPEGHTMDYTDFEIRLEEVFRFDVQDTLVFRVTLKNKTEREITYKRDSFSVRVGDRLYTQSVSDATGSIPPLSESTGYFAITGTPSGGRNDISLKNDFTVLVTRVSPEVPRKTALVPAKSTEGYAK